MPTPASRVRVGHGCVDSWEGIRYLELPRSYFAEGDCSHSHHNMALISPRSRPVDILRSIWAALQLPPDSVSVLELDRIPKPLVPSSYKVTGAWYDVTIIDDRTRPIFHCPRGPRDIPRPVTTDGLRTKSRVCRSSARRGGVLFGEV